MWVLILKLSKSFYNESDHPFHAHKSWLLICRYRTCEGYLLTIFQFPFEKSDRFFFPCIFYSFFPHKKVMTKGNFLNDSQRHKGRQILCMSQFPCQWPAMYSSFLKLFLLPKNSESKGLIQIQ